MGSMQCLVLTLFHVVLTVDRNKGDIKRNVCMDSVDLRRVDGHLFRKMKIAWVVHLTNVSLIKVKTLRRSTDQTKSKTKWKWYWSGR